MSAFDEVSNRTKSTVAVVAHDNKAGSDLSGSQVVRNALKWVVRLILPPEFEHDPEGGVETPERILQLNKLKTGKTTSWHLRLDGPGQWAFHGNAREHRKAALSHRIEVNLFDHGPATTGEIAKELKARKADVVAACAELLLAGKVKPGERARTDGKPGRGAVTYEVTGVPIRPLSGEIRVSVKPPVDVHGNSRSASSGTAGPEQGNWNDRSETQGSETKEMTLKKELSFPNPRREGGSKGSRGTDLSFPVVSEKATVPDLAEASEGPDPDGMFDRWRSEVE